MSAFSQRIPAVLLGLALLLPVGFATAAAAQAGEPEPQMSAVSPEAEPAAQPAKRSRLRFRGNGPTCMCADGLSERDIRKAETAKSTPPPTQSTDH